MPPRRRLDAPRTLGAVAAAAFVLARVVAARHSDLWFDELFSVGLASGSWGDLLRGAAADQTNPPLFYALLKGWLALTPATPGWLRTLPALISIATLWPLTRFFRSAGLDRSGSAVGILLVGVLPALALATAEVRAYALLLFCATCSAALALELAVAPEVNRRQWGWFTALSVALAYTHYYGWLVVAAELLALWMARPALRRAAAASFAFTLLAFLPWVLAVFGAARHAGAVAPTLEWIGRPAPFELVRTPLILLGGANTALLGLLAALVLVPAAWAAIGALRSPRTQPARLALTLLAAFPVAAAFAASWVLPRAIWGERYLIIIVAPLIALCLCAWAPPARRWGRVVAVVAILTGAFVGWARAGGAKIPWQAVEHELAAGDGTPVPQVAYTFEGFTGLPLAYYSGLAEDSLQVRPLRALSAIDRPGWVVVRDSAMPGYQQWRGAGPALAAAGWMAGDSLVVTAPHQRIAAYRIERTAPR